MKTDILKLLMFVSKQSFYIFIIQLIGMQLLFAAGISGQHLKKVKVTIVLEDAGLPEIFDQIEAKTVFVFAYDRTITGTGKKMDVNFTEKPLVEVLRYLSKEAQVDFRRVNNTISVTKQPKAAHPIKQNQGRMTLYRNALLQAR